MDSFVLLLSRIKFWKQDGADGTLHKFITAFAGAQARCAMTHLFKVGSILAFAAWFCVIIACPEQIGYLYCAISGGHMVATGAAVQEGYIVFVFNT